MSTPSMPGEAVLADQSSRLLKLATAGRGSHRSEFKFDTVRAVAEFIDNSGLVECFASWRAHDENTAARQVGRRPVLRHRDRVVLVVLVLLAIECEDLLVSRMTETLRHRLNARSLRLLDIDPDNLPVFDPQRPSGAGEQETTDPLYDVVYRAVKRFLAVIDSAPRTPGRRLPMPLVRKIRAARDPEECRIKQARALWVSNTLLYATFMTLPEETRKAWLGDICVDATPIPVWGKRGTPPAAHENDTVLCSPDIDAAWYVREADHRDPTDGKGRKRDKSMWAHEATFAVMTPDNPEQRPAYPLLVVAMSMDKPAGRVGENAMACVNSLRDRDLPARYFVGDRAYLPNSKTEKLQLPLRALGYEVVADYRDDQLGIQATREGAIQVEGHWYCPSMPQPLIDATKDVRAGHIDDDTYDQRIARRATYLLTKKQSTDSDGYTPMRCPAAGPSPTFACPLKKTAGKKTALGMPPILNPPVEPPRICTNRQSVTFRPEDGAKYGQSLRYGTPEWRARYGRDRNTIEGFNGFVKDPAYGDLAQPGRRRMRGYTAQLIFTALTTTAANIRKIWLHARTPHHGESTSQRSIHDRRRRSASLPTRRPDPHESPGVGPPADQPAANIS